MHKQKTFYDNRKAKEANVGFVEDFKLQIRVHKIWERLSNKTPVLQ